MEKQPKKSNLTTRVAISTLILLGATLSLRTEAEINDMAFNNAPQNTLNENLVGYVIGTTAFLVGMKGLLDQVDRGKKG